MSSTPQGRQKRTLLSSILNTPQDNHRSVQILLVVREPVDVELRVRALKLAGFKVSADVVVTPEQFMARLNSQSYDLVVAEYPNPKWNETPAMELLRQLCAQVPLIFVSEGLDQETVAKLIAQGAYDCIDMDRISHLPIAIHHALDEANLRMQRDRAEKMLKYSEAKYRALLDNLTYGICRFSLHGKFLDVNHTLMTMLGYTSKEELLASNFASAVIMDADSRARLLGQLSHGSSGSPFETEWRGKNGKSLRVRLTGREVRTGQGAPDSYEVIVEDVSKQRALEDQLRLQATHDPLTGLANYAELVDVISSEIKRSKRTGRDFALLLLDMDELKQVNDRYGHLVGSKALCRLADALSACSRNIDTAARYGGDEFALVLPETGAGTADVVARRVCECLANDSKEPRISVSVGSAIYPRDGKTLESLLLTADRALYKMKNLGKNHPPARSSFDQAPQPLTFSRGSGR